MNRRLFTRLAPILALALTTAAVVPITVASASGGQLDAASVRAAAKAAGLDSLAHAVFPARPDVATFLKTGTAANTALNQLGKSLFWDMQVGSDGQACASCHFSAGADNRSKNQLSPGLLAGDTVFGNPGASVDGNGFPQFKPNYQLTAADFPTHGNGRDTNDVISSQGVFNSTFVGLSPDNKSEVFNSPADPVFNVGGVNTRRVEPRNTPTTANAVFNVFNFWDGRAHNAFNGASPIGPLDPSAKIFVGATGTPVPTTVSVRNSSLASQSVGPPLSPFEMSADGKNFSILGRKMLAVTPLNRQHVAADDSILGPLAKPTTGLTTTYRSLIQAAFKPAYWANTTLIGGFTQISTNFPLFFGLSVQAYESLLVSGQSPFDRFMDGNNTALSQDQLDGLLTFANQGPARSTATVFEQAAGVGNCVSCHSGPEFTTASFTNLSVGGDSLNLKLTEIVPVVVPSGGGGGLEVGTATAFRDRGFANIGVRPTAEDVGRGGTLNGHPASFVRQALANDPVAPEALPACGGAGQPVCPVGGRTAVDGAFKIPGLRNLEFSGPYFHNGGQATLKQVMKFYQDQGDFKTENVANLDAEMLGIDIGGGAGDKLVSFLLSLTDDRVRNEKAPFDHPQIFVPNGSPGNSKTITCPAGQAVCDTLITKPATGAGGRPAAGLPPLGRFLKLSPFDN